MKKFTLPLLIVLLLGSLVVGVSLAAANTIIFTHCG